MIIRICAQYRQNGRCFLSRQIFIVAEYNYKIKLLRSWNDDLKDNNSEAFKDLKIVLEEEVMWCCKTELAVSFLLK